MSMSFPGRVVGKVALVTGAASGIGQATACLLAKHGAKVWSADVRDTSETLAAIEKDGGWAKQVPLDVSSEEHWKSALDAIRSSDKRLDILVNNAGISPYQSLEQTSLDTWNKVFAVNSTGAFLGCKYGTALMKHNQPDTTGGASINISSGFGIIASPSLHAYCAAKGSVRLLTKSVALETARNRLKIRVNSVHPACVAVLLRSGQSSADEVCCNGPDIFGPP